MTLFSKERDDRKKEMDIYPYVPTTSLHVMYVMSLKPIWTSQNMKTIYRLSKVNDPSKEEAPSC